MRISAVETVAWSTSWAALGTDVWVKQSKKWKDLLRKYEDHVVAYVHGHKHTHYSWEDTPDDKSNYMGYGDGVEGAENVGHFVNGSEINRQDRKYPPHNLPEIYFLNPQGLCFAHGKPYRKGGTDLISSSAVYYGDLIDGKSSFDLITRDIFKNKDVDSYEVKTKFPIDTGDRQIRFMESDLAVRTKDECIEMCVDEWFKLASGESGEAIFQKQWNKLVDIKGVEVFQDSGSFNKPLYKGSTDNGKTWSDWSLIPPEDINTLQVRILFEADGNRDMKVKDVKVNTL